MGFRNGESLGEAEAIQLDAYQRRKIIGFQFLNEYVDTVSTTHKLDTVVFNLPPVGSLYCDRAPPARRRLDYLSVCTMH